MAIVTPPRAAEPLAPVPAPGSDATITDAAPRRPLFVFWPEDGIITVLLLALAVYITVASIQAVTPPWAPGMQILTPLTLLGLLMGYLAVQQRLVAPFLVHLLALVVGAVVAFWQTANVVVNGKWGVLWTHLGIWLQRALHNQNSSDNTVFLLLLAALSYLLAYLSFWLVIHSRRPWLAVLACGVVLLINLNYASPDLLIFLVLFLLVSLLLLVRFTLAEHMRLWRFRRLRFSPDLSWDFLQAGAIFAVVVLLLAYTLPVAAPNPAISQIWTNPGSVWQGVVSRWEALFGNLNGPGTGGIGFFSDTLQLRGDVKLPNVEIFRYNISDPSQYLVTQTYDTYDGRFTWSQSVTQNHGYDANATLPGSAPPATVHTVTQAVYLTNNGNGQKALFAAGEPESFNLATDVAQTTEGGVPTSWQSQDLLISGTKYTAQSYVSSATVAQLEAVPYPAAAPQDAYPQAILDRYLVNNNTTISPDVYQTAKQWTAGTSNAYDALVAIESQLHLFTFSYTNGTVPSDQDAVVWFLQNKHGYCTFFASTMALMARSLGLPARIASGVNTGTYDVKDRDYVEKGTDLHVWTQVYFAGYGWINFEPTASYPLFGRGVIGGGPNGNLTPTAQASGTANANGTPTPRFRGGTDVPTGQGQVSPAVTTFFDLGLALLFLLAFALLVVAGFLLWWRALYRRLPPAAGAFARITRLGAWSGSPPRRDQTPYEYAGELAAVIPAERATLDQLSDLYVRDRWGGVRAPAGRAQALYQRVRLALAWAIVARWREIPGWFLARLGRVRTRLLPKPGALRRRLRRVSRYWDPPPFGS
jgi:transglutaminase-like putative cysteine protease